MVKPKHNCVKNKCIQVCVGKALKFKCKCVYAISWGKQSLIKLSKHLQHTHKVFKNHRHVLQWKPSIGMNVNEGTGVEWLRKKSLGNRTKNNTIQRQEKELKEIEMIWEENQNIMDPRHEKFKKKKKAAINTV